MDSFMRRVLKTIGYILRPFVRVILLLFFDRNYLRGRYFEKSLIGYVWALRAAWIRNILRLAPPMPWPVALTCSVSNPKNIHFHPDDLSNFQSPGVYLQNFKGHIFLGRGSYIAPNVGLITANHKLDDLDSHEDGRDIHIGEGCWIGMNSVVLPGVTLGARTIVAAGAVVTKSFPEGNAVIGGVPAKVIKRLTGLPVVEQ